MTEYKVADIGLAGFGRKEITIAEKEMERIEMLMALGGRVLRIGEKI